MGRGTVCLCVTTDKLSFLKWTLSQYKKDLAVTSCGEANKLQNIRGIEGLDVLIIDSSSMNDAPLSYLQKIREVNPSLNILFIVAPMIKKEEVIEIIRGKFVKGMIVMPFSAEVLCNYLDKMNFGRQT
jgi:DNA-binding NtrC family response regulator